MLSLVWIDQIYAIIQSTRFQKDAIRFKYLFVARLQENLPPDFIDSSHTIADVYDIPPPHNIESSIMPVPAIPDYSDILLSQEEANILLEEEITKNKIRIYDRYPTTQQVQDSLEKQQTEKKETVEPSEQNIVTTSKKLPDNNKSTVTENPKIHDITLQKTTDKNESIHMKR